MRRRVKIATVHCPDWLDRPLMVFIIIFWIAFVVGLALAYSFWWLLLFLLTPSFERIKHKKELEEKEGHGEYRAM